MTKELLNVMLEPHNGGMEPSPIVTKELSHVTKELSHVTKIEQMQCWYYLI